jgi:autophagy-related protein 2
MRRRLAKLKQMLAEGQTYDPAKEHTSALLYNSVYVGLEQDVDDLEPEALIAAIEEELDDDDGFEVASQSSWQSLRPVPAVPQSPPSTSLPQPRPLKRSRGAAIEFRLLGVNAEFDMYRPDNRHASRTFVTIRDVQILDHIKTSTWKMFLTDMRADLRGNIRESESNMVRLELKNVRPVSGHASEESRLRVSLNSTLR